MESCLVEAIVPIQKFAWGFLRLGGVSPISAVWFYLTSVFLSQNYGFPKPCRSVCRACAGNPDLVHSFPLSPTRSLP
jgi:hypothetical protein